MNKNGKMEVGGKLVIFLLSVISLVLVVGGLAAMGIVNLPAANKAYGVTTGQGYVTSDNNCGDTKTTTFSAYLYNKLDTTTDDVFNASYYIYDESGNLVASGTATDGSETESLTCGANYKLRLISGDGSSGDNAKVLAVRAGNAKVVEDGRAVEFYTGEPTQKIYLEGSKHGILEAKFYDEVAMGWTYETQTLSTATAGTYTKDGGIFSSTVNGTNYTVGTAGEVKGTFYIRANITDERFNDFGMYIAVDAATSVWDIPTVKINGVTLSDYKGSLNVNEARAYSGYEYIYKTSENIDNDDVKVYVRFKALAGVNPAVADSPQVDFISIGAKKETSGNDVLYAGVGDDSSATTIFAVQDYTIAVA